MEYIDIAHPGLKASRIGLSTCTMSRGVLNQVQRQSSKETIIEALNKGINVIDIGLIGEYGFVEEAIGRVINEYGNRKNVIVVAKTIITGDHDAKGPGNLSQMLEQTLKRLRTDYVDIYEIPQAAPPMQREEIIRTIEGFVEEGKVRLLGIDDQSRQSLQVFSGCTSIRLAQFPYNMFEREAEYEVIPYLQKNNMVAIINRSLCSGILAGSVTRDTALRPGDLRLFDPLFHPKNLPRCLSAVADLDLLAREILSKKVIHLSIRWLLDRMENAIVLWSAGSPEQLDPVDEIMGWHLDDGVFAGIEKILARTAEEKGRQVYYNLQPQEEK